MVVRNVDLIVSEKAEEIRSKALSEGRKIKTPDAQHIATAIIHLVNAFHSLDDKLIKLSGSSVVDGLIICKPISKSGQAFLG